MAIRQSFRHVQETTAALRQIPLATVIPMAFPDAKGPMRGQGRDVVQWELADGTKINVKTTGQSDLYRIWSGPQAGRAGTGAINFLVDLGVCGDFTSAKAWLTDAVPTVNPPNMAPTQPQAVPQPFRMPHFVRQSTAAWPLITEYLTDIRKIPASLLRTVLHQDPPAILAGWGPKYGHYLLFPCWDHSQPLKDSQPTGALLRWRMPGEPPPHEWFGGNPRPMAPGSRKRDGWWQIGPSDAPTLIITEAPIDSLSVAASLPAFTDQHPELAPGLAILALGGEAGFNPRQLEGHTRILCATDNDPAGDRFAAEIRAAAQKGQTVERVRPLAGTKDWNAAWQEHPDKTRAVWTRAMEVKECEAPEP